MGMTYRIIALPQGQSAKEWSDRALDADVDVSGDDLMGATELVNDMVFDRERLSVWLGLGKEDWADDGYAVMRPNNVRRARSVLQSLVDRVSSMPFTQDDPPKRIFWDSENHCPCDRYEGSEENIAIRKEVEKVLMRYYHFNYPWQPNRPFGVPYMINALDDVLAFMKSNPDRVVMALYY